MIDQVLCLGTYSVIYYYLESVVASKTYVGYVKFEVETGASPGWSPMVIYKGALVNIWLKG